MPVEVEGIRLIADLVVAGDYASILPETAIPPELANVRTVAIAGLPPRRLAMVIARDVQLSLADQAVRDSVAQTSSRSTCRRAEPDAAEEAGTVAHEAEVIVRDRWQHNRSHDDGRKVNVKLILLGLLAAILVLFALLNTHEVGVDFVFNTWSTPLILVIAISAAIGFAIGFLVRGHLAIGRTTDRRYGRDGGGPPGPGRRG